MGKKKWSARSLRLRACRLREGGVRVMCRCRWRNDAMARRLGATAGVLFLRSRGSHGGAHVPSLPLLHHPIEQAR